MKQEVYIENLKCGGCANTIVNGVSSIKGVDNVAVSVDNSLVTFVSNEATLGLVKEKLSKLGYPEVGADNTVLHKAKSFVSCAVGRVQKS
ncbi:heavy-metal-associated domain-containing protein [uncultured Tenacibaculum sp.]|uniref:heavy-metal-associated domain-containing protein n=1 Tax=uncultured Tenacibaculum sp. TaxID=174713 RepID=UPI0026061341|nr:heavy-metal-associated domain-containing protein [uncultured Tenacibaculum sp.]